MQAGTNGKKISIIIIFNLFMAGMVLIIFFRFLVYGREYVATQNSRYLEDMTVKTVKQVETYLDMAQERLEMQAQIYEHFAEKDIICDHYVEIMEPNDPFAYIRFIENGKNVTGLEKYCYEKGIRGESGIAFGSENKKSKNDILFYTPLRYQDEIIGVLIAQSREEELQKMLHTELFGEDANTFLFTKDGILLEAYPKEENEDDILADLKENAVPKQSKSTEENSGAKENNSFIWKGEDGTSNIYVMSLAEQEWVILQKFPVQITDNMIQQFGVVGIKFMIELILLFLVWTGVWIIETWRQRRRLRKENEELKYIVQGTAKLFVSLVLLDFEKNTYRYLVGTAPVQKHISRTGEYSSMRELFVSMLMEKEDRAFMSEELKAERIQQNLKDLSEIKYRCHIMWEGERWGNLSLVCLERSNGIPVKVLLGCQDITALQKEEERQGIALKEAFQAAESANRAKSDFLSHMSHDIRTPMNAIMGMTELAQMHVEEPARVKEYLEKIGSANQHLLRLVNDVLDMSKIESGKVTLVEKPFSLLQMQDEIKAIFYPQVQEKGQTLEIQMDVKHTSVVGDMAHLQQVIVNILGNAVKYTQENGSISCLIREKEIGVKDVSCYEFVCTDNGIGMTEEYMQHIFEPFSRAEDTSTRKIEGTGLGMSITENLVQMMNGSIHVKSKLGEGSCFTVIVPLKLNTNSGQAIEQSETDNVLASADTKKQKNGYVGKRVLLVEDNELNMEIAEELLSYQGLIVEKAFDGKQAVERLSETPENYYAMVFMDIQMPNMNGYEATMAIRQSERKDLQEIPIVAMSADTFTADVQKAKSAGMNDHVPKPINISKLTDTLKEWIG